MSFKFVKAYQICNESNTLTARKKKEKKKGKNQVNFYTY